MPTVDTSTSHLTKPTVTKSASSIVVTAIVGLTLLMAVVFAAIFLLLGAAWWLSLAVGVLLALALAVAAVLHLRHSVGEALVASVGAIESTPTRGEARLINIVEGLSLSSGIREPAVYTIHDDAMNAAALDSKGTSSILVTSGLIENLSRVELEGVVAELIARIKSGDAEVAALGSAIYGPLVSGPANSLTRPLGLKLLNGLYVPDRELLSDASAVMLTRYPPGLLYALKKIAAGRSHIEGAPSAYDAVWLIPPTAGAQSEKPATYIANSGIGLRIDVLAEL